MLEFQGRVLPVSQIQGRLADSCGLCFPTGGCQNWWLSGGSNMLIYSQKILVIWVGLFLTPSMQCLIQLWQSMMVVNLTQLDGLPVSLNHILEISTKIFQLLTFWGERALGDRTWDSSLFHICGCFHCCCQSSLKVWQGVWSFDEWDACFDIFKMWRPALRRRMRLAILILLILASAIFVLTTLIVEGQWISKIYHLMEIPWFSSSFCFQVSSPYPTWATSNFVFIFFSFLAPGDVEIREVLRP